MKYEVKFSKEVLDIITCDFRSKINNREAWRLARATEVEFSTLEVWIDMIDTLQTSPYTYPEYNNVYLAIELYMPYILVYKIVGEEVIVFKALKREELFS